jgi:hypothetical protein
MATVPTAYTWTVGELVTAAKLNAYLQAAIAFLLAPPYGAFQRTTSQSIGNSSTTPVGWDLEVADTDGAHSTVTNNDRFTCQTAGVYENLVAIPWVGNATGVRELNFGVNGVTSYAGSRLVPGSAVGFVNPAGKMLPLSVGDYVNVKVWQSSTVALSVDQTFASGPTWDILWKRT